MCRNHTHIFYLEWVGLVTPSVNTRSLLDDLVVLFFAIALNTVLLNASIRRVEEKADVIRQTSATLAAVNRELQISETELQRSRAELEERVERRTEELSQSNTKLQAEIEERQRVLDALRTSEANWRSLAEYLPESIATIKRDHTIAFINRHVHERFEYTSCMLPFLDARPALLEARQRKLGIGVLSNFSLASLDGSLAAVDLAELVDVACAATVIGAAKPDAKAYLTITQLLGVQPEECLFFDDEIACVEGGRAVGMQAYLVDRQSTKHEIAKGIVCDLTAVAQILG